ncbi:homeobox-leucine zipper protein HDG11-like [Vicia villosa]|uniref:homeobox-leucine zipper protein HDG11-like n=1 Tax=Vicia villosa TaxID=3911 RepID=UPI00273CD701|nr:homeobox-leucine zipper protein HDG11-like [Vicia villosa]
MNSSLAGAGAGSGDDEIDNSSNDRRASYKRLTTTQSTILENFMKECHHPDDAQRRQLAEEVGLEPKQIKFWFQNKRTLMKNQHERENNSSLRLENERIHNENLLIKEALKATICSTCGGPPFPQEEHEHFMRSMEQENAQLKQECDKVSNLIANYMEKKISLPEFEQALATVKSFSRDRDLELSPNQTVYETLRHVHVHVHGNLSMREAMLVNISEQSHDEQKRMMSRIATIAMEELARLVRVNEPFWVYTTNAPDGRFTLDRESYEQVFPKDNHFQGANVCEESSKFSGVVKLGGLQLVDMFLDPVKWKNLFPTIVTKAETVKEFEPGSTENRDGALLLMHEQMHILSPLVRPREFNILRYCKQVDAGVWMITDVSIDSSRPNTIPLCQSWKYPSGCIIRELPHGACLVTWVEHVEVEDKIHTHLVYRHLIRSFNLYGAESWIKELQRMCERSISFYAETTPNQETAGVITSIEGRQSVMKFAHRMVKMLCESLTMSGQLEFQHVTLDSVGGVRVSIRKNNNYGQPKGTVAVAATTIWLPLPAQKIFEFLRDPTKRSKWDVLSSANPMVEIAHISNGPYPGNSISIIQPSIPREDQPVILQESFTSTVGSYIIFAPTDRSSMNIAIRGEESKGLEILPTGFVICSKAKPNATFETSGNIGSGAGGGGEAGSLLTLAYQILISTSTGIGTQQHMESMASINSLLSGTVRNIKDALM